MEDKEKLTLGILAHVDAGKTTLAESILYLRGSIRKIGRVDHGDEMCIRDRHFPDFDPPHRSHQRLKPCGHRDRPGKNERKPDTFLLQMVRRRS